MDLREAITARLDPDEKIDKTWAAQYERKGGDIVMSQKRFFFVESKGFLNKTYTIILELPYTKVKKVVAERTKQLAITDQEGHTYIFKTEIDAARVEQSFDEIIPRPVSP